MVTGSFAGWLDIMLNVADEESRKVIAMTCRAIWKSQNELVWENKGSNGAAVAILAHNSLYQWSRAQDKNITPTAAFLTSEDGRERWTKPGGDAIKINVDAALFTEERKFSFVCVARNGSGDVMEARTSCRIGDVTPETAEAMGVREALSWTKGKEWHNVVVETDSLTVVQCLRSPLPMLSYFGSVINDCKVLRWFYESISKLHSLLIKL